MDRREYEIELSEIHGALSDEERDIFMRRFLRRARNPVVMYGFNLWLGVLGVDRFILGDILAGFLKLITVGGFGIWIVVDCFLIGNRTRDRNIDLARDLYHTITERTPRQIMRG